MQGTTKRQRDPRRLLNIRGYKYLFENPRKPPIKLFKIPFQFPLKQFAKPKSTKASTNNIAILVFRLIIVTANRISHELGYIVGEQEDRECSNGFHRRR